LINTNFLVSIKGLQVGGTTSIHFAVTSKILLSALLPTHSLAFTGLPVLDFVEAAPQGNSLLQVRRTFTTRSISSVT